MNKIKSFFDWVFPKWYDVIFHDTKLASIRKGWFSWIKESDIQTTKGFYYEDGVLKRGE